VLGRCIVTPWMIERKPAPASTDRLPRAPDRAALAKRNVGGGLVYHDVFRGRGPAHEYFAGRAFYLTQNLDGKPGNRRLTDIVAARDAALRLAGLDALAGFLLLMGCEFRLAAELDTLRLGVSPAARGALDDPANATLSARSASSCDSAYEKVPVGALRSLAVAFLSRLSRRLRMIKDAARLVATEALLPIRHLLCAGERACSPYLRRMIEALVLPYQNVLVLYPDAYVILR